MRDDSWRVTSKGSRLAANEEKTKCMSMSVGRGAGQNDDMTVGDTSCEGAADCKQRGETKLACV